MGSKTRWYVITGGPCSGKTTVLSHFERMGYRVIPEAARVLIDEEISKGRDIKEIRGDEAAFQKRVLEMKIKIEKNLPKDQVILFDRAIPDSMAYYILCGLDPKEVIDVCENKWYRKVFFMEQLPFTKDYARTEETHTVERLNQFLRESYQKLGYEVISVPVMSIEERVRFIKDHLDVEDKKPKPD
jgi:predicted ATPase